MKKRIVALLLAALLVMTLAACGGNNTSSTTPSSKAPESSTTEPSQTTEESSTPVSSAAETNDLGFGPDNPIELTAVCSVSEIQGDFNEIQILKDYAEKSGIHITFQGVPSADRATQLNLMMGSGEVPDRIWA